MWSLTHFDDILQKSRQNEGVKATYSVISWSANFYWWILRVQSAGERYFSAAWNLLNMTQERFSNLTVLNSHKERTAKFTPPPIPPPQFKRGGYRPSYLKICSASQCWEFYFVQLCKSRGLVNVLTCHKYVPRLFINLPITIMAIWSGDIRTDKITPVKRKMLLY